MLDNMEIRDEIDSAIEFCDSAMPEPLRNLRRLALSDLRNGPVYLDECGDSVSCFDEGARRFNFSAACSDLAAWAEDIGDICVESSYCEETDESTYESIDGSRDEILKSLFGDLLAYM